MEPTANDDGHDPVEEQAIDRCAYTYFKAPITTLLESSQPDAKTLHKDLSQAYSLLYAQFKTVATSLSLLRCTSPEYPALDYLKAHASDLTRCIKRDMERALIDLITHGESSSQAQYGSIVYSAIIPEEKFQELKDMADISQRALQFASCIFSLPAFASVFSDDELVTMLTVVVNILQSRALLTPGELKTRSIAFCALTVIRLPMVIVAPMADMLMALLNSVLVDQTGTKADLNDALKTLHNLLLTYPTLFLRRALTLYEPVLKHVVSPNLITRLKAAYAVAGYAHAVVSSYAVDSPISPSALDRYEETRASIRRRTSRFVKAQEEERRKLDGLARIGHPVTALTLRKLLQAEIPPSADIDPGPQVGWAFSVLGCLTVLAGSAAFIEADHMRFILRVLPPAGLDHLWSPLRPLHGFVWRCLVWNFQWTPYMARTKSISKSDDWRVIKRQQFTDFIRQAPISGVGASLVCAILGKDEKPFSPELEMRLPRQADVVRTLTVVKNLVVSPGKSLLGEGVAVLRRLTSEIGVDTSTRVPSEWNPNAVLLLELLDGVLVEIELRHLPPLMRNSKTFDIDSIRPLSTGEIESHWDELLSVWLTAARRVLKDNNYHHLQSDILHIWQALLLVQVQLTPSYAHLTSITNYSDRILGVVRRFLTVEASGSPGQESDRFCPDSSAKELWVVMKRVFCSPWRKEAAEILLRFMLREGLLDRLVDASDALQELCADLIFTANPKYLALIAADAPSQEAIQVVQDLWYSVAPSWPRHRPIPAWRDVVSFLALPMRWQAFADADQAAWSNLLDYAVEVAVAAGEPSHEVLEQLANQLPDDMSNTNHFLRILLSRVQLGSDSDIPRILLTHIDEHLRGYPTSAQDIYLAINFIDSLSQFILTCTIPVIVPVLKCLQAGMRAWLLAGPTFISDQDYDQHIIPFYQNSLKALRPAATSLDVVRELEAYLCAPFDNIRTEALGPAAFKEFWDDVSGGMDITAEEFPPSLKIRLGAWYTAFGGIQPSYLAEDSQLSTQHSIVPDSQPCESEEQDEMWPFFAEANLDKGVGVRREPLPRDNELRHSITLETEAPPMAELPTPFVETKNSRALSTDDKGQSSASSALRKRNSRSVSTDGQHVRKRARPARKPSVSNPQRLPTSSQKTTEGDMSDLTEIESSPPVSPQNSSDATLPGVHTTPLRDIGNRPSREASPAPYHSLPSPPLSIEVSFVEGRVSPELGEYVALLAGGEQSDPVEEASHEDDEIYKEVDTSQSTEHELRIPVMPQRNTRRYEEREAPSPSASDRHAQSSRHATRSYVASRPSRPEPTSLQALRQAHEVMLEEFDTSEISADDIVTAQELLHRMNGLLTGTLRRRLRG